MITSWTTWQSVLPIRLHRDEPLTHPPSVTALAGLTAFRADAATTVIRAALLELIARNYAEVRPAKTSIVRFQRWQSPPVVEFDHRLVQTGDTRLAGDLGVLESELLRLLPENASTGLSVRDVVCAWYEKPRSSPTQWLIKKVAGDAAARGLVRRKDRSGRMVAWEPDHEKTLKREVILVERLSHQLREQQPEFSEQLDNDILSAMNAQTEA